MKYLLISICCFILSSCMTIPDQSYHTVECSNRNACSEAELNEYINRFNPVTDIVIKNGFEALHYNSDQLDYNKDKVNKTSFSIFYLEYDEKGKKFEGNRQLDIIKHAIDASDKPVYLNIYVNSWHNNANSKEPLEITKEAKYFPHILARRHFNKSDMNIIGVYIGWQGEKYKGPIKWITPKFVSDIADRIGKEGDVRLDIISMVDHVQMNPHSGHSLIMGKSFGARLLSRAFMNDLIEMKSIEDWPLGKQSLLVNLNPAIGANAFDKVFKSMPGKGADVQRPVWLNMTSEDDKATNGIYSSARFIGQNLSSEPVEPGMAKTRKAIGHYVPYLSHWVTSTSGVVGPDPKNNTEEDLIRCNFENVEGILKDNKSWFKIPSSIEDCATRHLYENKLSKDDKYRYYTTTLRPLDWNKAMTAKKSLGYMWNFRIDKSIIENGSADSRFSKGYHSADVQTILGRMLDDMLFTPPEKPLD